MEAVVWVEEGGEDVDEADAADEFDQAAIEKERQGQGSGVGDKAESRGREPAHRFKVCVREEVKWVSAGKHVVPNERYHEHHRENRER